MTEFERLVVDHLRANLFKQDWFSIFEVDALLEVLGRRDIVSTQEHRVANTMHLQAWNSMTQETRQALKDWVLKVTEIES